MHPLFSFANIGNFIRMMEFKKIVRTSTSHGSSLSCELHMNNKFICRYQQNLHSPKAIIAFCDGGRELIEKAFEETDVAADFLLFKERNKGILADPKMLTGRFEDMLECIIHSAYLARVELSVERAKPARGMNYSAPKLISSARSSSHNSRLA